MRNKKTLSQLRQSYQWGSKINLLGGRLYSPWVSEYQHPIAPICIRVRESWLTVMPRQTVAIGRGLGAGCMDEKIGFGRRVSLSVSVVMSDTLSSVY